MCTAATYKTKGFYFGRTLDVEATYGESVVITPRNFPLTFRHGEVQNDHFAMIGIAHVSNDYPLYYDAMNEEGLCMAGLNFVGNAVYTKAKDGFYNVAQFELIPWILSRCKTAKEAAELLKNTNVTDTPFNPSLPVASLHWLLADKSGSFTVEAVEEGLKVYKNPVGILTNNPPFDKQLFRLRDYMNLSPKEPCNNFSDKLSLAPYSRGMGAMGLPGDLSSSSRFIRASFVKMNSLSGDSEEESVTQFFHILGSVAQPKGCCDLGSGKYEITYYTSCCSADRGIYYYTTYNNSMITAVSLQSEDLDSNRLISYPLTDTQQFRYQN